MKTLNLHPISILSLFLAFSILFRPISAHAIPGDEHWDAQFGVAGVTNTISAIAVNQGLLYVAGAVPSGTTTNTPLYVWDGKQWSVFAMFYGPSSMQVIDLAFVGNTLYVAGTFTNVNGVAANGLAKWDGASWSGIGFSGTAAALAVDGNNLYVGGLYANPGGVTLTNIGYWDGNLWHALGNGLGASSSPVRAVLAKNGVVYAGGSFNYSGSQAVTNLAFWNGSVWSPLGGGVNGVVLALAFNGNDLYAGGIFTQAGMTPANNIARWDGMNWNALGSGLSGSGASGIAILNGMVCITGSFTTAGSVNATNFAIWNGASWSAANVGLNATGVRVTANNTNVYVGGSFSAAGNILANEIASWDGNQWSSLGTPGRLNGVQSTVFALTSDGTNLFAGGLFGYAGQTNANYVAQFDGTNWYPLGSGIGPAGGTTIVRALAVTNNNVYVGGSFSSAGTISALNVAQWDGTNWNALANGPGGVVASLTARPDGLYAAGAPASGVNYGSPFFNRWDGTNWNSALSFNPNDTFFSVYTTDANIGMDTVAFQNTNIFIGGHFNISWHSSNFQTTTNCYNIMRFDGTYCRIMGTGLNSNVVAMAVLSTNLYVAGLFTNAGGITASHIAQWDGNNWSAVGGGIVGSGSIFTLTTIGNNLYVGGSFTNIGGVTAQRIAKWDGTNWSALGSSIGGGTGSVQKLYASDSSLYVGGNFRVTGNKKAVNLGRWNDSVNFNIPQLINPIRLNNGQFAARLFGVSGLTNIIQVTTNFNIWTPILTNTAGIYDFSDSVSPNYPFRFYRAVLGP